MSDRPEVAFFGSSLVSAYWNGAATYYRGIIRALAGRGFPITFYEPDAYQRQQHRDMPDPPWARVVVYPADQQGVDRALENARRKDIIIKASGVGVFDEYLEHEVLSLRSSQEKRIIFWDVDAPATLQRVEQNPSDPFRSLIPRYDFILTYGGGEPVIRHYRQLGARQCTPIYNAVDPDVHYPVASDPRFAGRLGFLGNRMPDRETRVQEFFFRPAALLPEHRFVLGGSGWEGGLPERPNIRLVGHVYGRDHNAFNCTPAAVLNVNRQSMAELGYSPATRIFEAAGAAACLITDAWPGIDQFLEPEREVLVAADGDQVCCLVEQLTAHQARRIGLRARRRVLAHHTYAHRAEQVEQILLGCRSAAVGSRSSGV